METKQQAQAQMDVYSVAIKTLEEAWGMISPDIQNDVAAQLASDKIMDAIEILKDRYDQIEHIQDVLPDAGPIEWDEEDGNP